MAKATLLHSTEKFVYHDNLSEMIDYIINNKGNIKQVTATSFSLDEDDIEENVIENIHKLINVISDEQNISGLNLYYAGLHDEDAKSIADIISNNSSHFKHLDISYNKFSNEGIEVIAAALEKCGNIATISCHSNSLTNTGLFHLIESIEDKPLEYLSLGDNYFGAESVQKLINLIDNDDNLRIIEVIRGDLSISDIIEIYKHCEVKDNIEFIDISYDIHGPHYDYF